MTIHAIPWVAVDVGASMFFIVLTLHARAGPRWRFADLRSPDQTGFTFTASALAGYRLLLAWEMMHEGLTAALAVDATWWVARHLGFSVELSAGGYFTTANRVFPDARLTVGFAF